nr:MAG TPA: hypothetical protein [Caudoviricetes sp.]
MCTCFLQYRRHIVPVYVGGWFRADFVFFGDLAV